ncbi:transaldolase [Sulfurimonas sp. HSL-1716]|uniref:transaldolase n=1 Tax=Hydrocurvibacter sulfurireducens TaxID=3131937 RepID=UPI0031F8D507
MYIKDLKFSLWADFIERDYLDKEFKQLINQGIINGATSNPAIFKNAILSSPAYKEQLSSLDGLSAKEKYEALAIFDIQKAADILKPLYDKGDDGYVSIEVDPFLCDDAQATVAEGKRLHDIIARDNIMIKVPATDAGYIAMEELSASGIPVNATLIFSKEQAVSCAKAFARGQQRSSKEVDTVISVFVSRIDRALDDILISKGMTPSLTGVYNAADIYNSVEALQVKGCRTLFASTGVKGDNLRASYYVDELLAGNSVNTAPIDTIKAYVQGGDKTAKLPLAQEKIDALFQELKEAEIDFDEVVRIQIEDGLEAFKEAFKEILENL